MAVILLCVLVIGLPLFILLKNQYGSKRGCGRGCSTCGNRHICHGTGAYKDHPHDQKGTDQ